MGTRFRSSEELFAATRALVRRLELAGLEEAAAELAEGYACLNGLTDGWALFLESIERVRSEWTDALRPEDRETLEDVLHDVRRHVYGKR